MKGKISYWSGQWFKNVHTQSSRSYKRSVALHTPNLQDQNRPEWSAGIPGNHQKRTENLPSPTGQNPLTLKLRRPKPPKRHTEPSRVRGNLRTSFSTQHSCASNSLHRLLFLTFCYFSRLHLCLGMVWLLFVLFSLVSGLFMHLT